MKVQQRMSMKRITAVSSSFCDRCNVYIYDEIDRIGEDRLSEWHGMLSEGRLKKSSQYKFFRDRRISELAYILLRIAIYDHLGIHKPPEFCYGSFGKPYITSDSDIFSLSHSTGIVMCSYGCKCGCDVQENEPALTEAVKTIITNEEMQIISNEDIREKLRIWTMKEAYGKYLGKGLNYNTCDVSFAEYLGNDGLSRFIGANIYSYATEDVALCVISDLKPVIKKLSYEELCEKCRTIKKADWK